MLNRRGFVFSVPALLAAGVSGVRQHRIVVRVASDHPTPRPGITAANVLTREQLGSDADLVKVFDMVREIPQVVDGIQCQCGCSGQEGKYSLLSCFEGTAMAQHCQICQGEGRLVYRLHKQGKSLNDIRAAIDAKYG